MSVTELKAQIHEAVESIEDVALLQTILTFTKAPVRIDDEPLTDEELQMLEKRHQVYLRGEAKPTPWREVQARMKEKHGL